MALKHLRALAKSATGCRAWRWFDPAALPVAAGREHTKRPSSSSAGISSDVGIDRVDCVVVGAGVVGLAIARSLALQGREVLVLDKHRQIGCETSSRNSEVIHAGIYYQPGSLKGHLCLQGKNALYEYCRSHGVPHKQTGKLIVATSRREEDRLEDIRRLAAGNGVADLQLLSRSEVLDLEPALETCRSALLSPSTGIIDSHSLMQAMLADLEAEGGAFVGGSRLVSGEAIPGGAGFRMQIEDVDTAETMPLHASLLVNAAGLYAQEVAASIMGVQHDSIPLRYLARGCYFTTNQKLPFSHLIYPVPVDGGLGVHLTLDLSGAARFGPDVEWVDSINYQVRPNRAEQFYDAIRRYFPALPNGCLQPDYAGIRPKVTGPGEPAGDFVISGPESHGIPGLINLYGIESPGLTASMAIADRVKEKLLTKRENQIVSPLDIEYAQKN